jgi:hypothetical protein
MKDAYYFPHDSNAKDDPKIVIMLEQHGLEAYGIYWILIETLRDQPDFRAPMAIIPGLARRYNTTPDKMKSVVLGYGLFDVDEDDFFISDSLNRRMEEINSRRQKLSEAGKRGNEKRWALTDGSLSPGDRNPIASKGKESKEKESKEKEKRGNETAYSRPKSKDDIELIEFFGNNGSTTIEAARFFTYYQSQGWLKSNNMPIADWQSLAYSWIQRSLFDYRYMQKADKKVILTPDFSHLQNEEK